MSLKIFEEEDEGIWVLEDFAISDVRPPIRVSVMKEGGALVMAEMKEIVRTTEKLELLILRASELLLENYADDHVKQLGVSEENLVEEKAEAVAARVILHEVSFYDVAGGHFALSFTAPWDLHHTCTVEFEAGKPTRCSVNG